MKRIVFMGTPDFAVPSLAILAEHYEIAAVVTTPDKPSGRGLKMNASAVKQFAETKVFKILQPENLRDEGFIGQLLDLNADLFVVVAFRKLPAEVWKMPPMGTINLHASLLPQYRGAAPINWAIINGESKTGLTTFFINENIDTGDMLLTAELEIGPSEDFGSLYGRMQEAGADLLLNTLEMLFTKGISPLKQPQSEILHPAPKLNRDNCRLNWLHKGKELVNLVRGLSPLPGAYTILRRYDGQEFEIKIFSAEFVENQGTNPGKISTDGKKVLRVDCQDGFLNLSIIRFSGKKTMLIDEFLRGYRFYPEDRML